MVVQSLHTDTHKPVTYKGIICKYKLTHSLTWCTAGIPMLLLMLTTSDVFFRSECSSTSTC